MDELARTAMPLGEALVLLENGRCPFCKLVCTDRSRGFEVYRVTRVVTAERLAAYVKDLLHELERLSGMVPQEERQIAIGLAQRACGSETSRQGPIGRGVDV